MSAECGGGRIQTEDFLARVQMDPKASAHGLKQHRQTRHRTGTVDKISLSTIHAATGMEWKVVFVPRWNDGFIPLSRFAGVQELGTDRRIVNRQRTDEEIHNDLEEERRLGHVAVTRAKQQLVIKKLKGDLATFQFHRGSARRYFTNRGGLL